MPEQEGKRKAARAEGPRGGTSTVYPSGLLRKTCYFNADEWEAVRRKAFAEEISMAEVVRAAVRAYLGVED